MVTKIIIGNIFSSTAQTLVNTVNCVGIMGKGIAADFKDRFPAMFREYKDRCNKGEIKPGIPYLSRRLVTPWILNFPTKNHWRSVSKIQDIEKGLKLISKNYKEWGIESLAIPPLGCGNGQLNWKDVGPLIYHYLHSIEIPVEIYAPFGTSQKFLNREFLEKDSFPGKNSNDRKLDSLNPAWIILVEILYELEQQPYHTSVGRTIFQKIAYIVTEQGIPTHFQFIQSSYGPFSKEIKQAITILANNGLVQEEKAGNMFKLTVGTKYLQHREKYRQYIEKYRKIIDRTTDLFARMDTEQAEITTSIFYTARQVKKIKKENVSECDIFDYLMNWKKRRRPPLDGTRVASAIRNLVILKWLKVEYCENLPVAEEVI